MKLFLEIGIIFMVCLAAQGIAGLLPFTFPSSVLAMILLFLLLVLKLVKLGHIENFSSFLLKNMAILFIPSGVGILNSFEALKGNVLPLLAICLITTVLTFAVTAYTVHGVIWLQQKFCRKTAANGTAVKENDNHE